MKQWLITCSDGTYYHPSGFVTTKVDAHYFNKYRTARLKRDALMKESNGGVYRIEPVATTR